jgi:hypothetical protein
MRYISIWLLILGCSFAFAKQHTETSKIIKRDTVRTVKPDTIKLDTILGYKLDTLKITKVYRDTIEILRDDTIKTSSKVFYLKKK